MAVTTHKTFCRFCHANCAIEVDVDGTRPIAVRGDASDPVYGGYTCIKGRQLAEAHTRPNRLLSPLAKDEAGTFRPIGSSAALDAIAARLRSIIDDYGPRAVATYNGTYAFQNSGALALAQAFHKGLGSTSFYTSVTIDQPAKVYTWARVGAWGGGTHCFSDADVSLMIGNNPVVGHYAPPGGVPPFSPSRRLRDAKARGMKLIVIDPRRTESAQLADLYLQVRPGEDVSVLAAMVRTILSQGLNDKAFCASYIDGIDALKAAVEPFTPDYAGRRAGVDPALIVQAARLFAAGPRGVATTGTGPEMSGRGPLMNHLVLALNYLCGRVYKAGEISPVPKLFFPVAPRRAEVVPPMALWGEGFPKARVRGLTALGEEMPCATLADEILEPGEGQIKALICVGGNPVVAWPNQDKVVRAMQALDLLVCVDVRLSQTAEFADYVLASAMCLERDDITNLSEWWFEEPYGRYTDAIVPAPGDTLDEWEMFWELAKRLGTPLPLAGGPLPMDRRPTKREMFTLMTAGMRLPLETIYDATREGGKVFPEAAYRVEPGDPANTARLQLGVPEVISELGDVAGETLDDRGLPPRCQGYSHLMSSRRTKHMFNSTGHDLPALMAKGTTNPAWMHPDDLAALGIAEGEIIELQSARATIVAVAQAAADVKPGVVSIAHAFGGVDIGHNTVRARGSSTNRLVDDETDYDPITGMARQSAIPVRVRRIASERAA